jgi:hypothetical protein
LDRADIDDGPPRLAQLIEERGHHVVGPVEIDRQRRVPVAAGVGIGHGAAADDAGVVDQDRNWAHLGMHPRGKRITLGTVGHVAGIGRSVAADRRSGAPRRIAVNIDGDNARSLARHRLCDRRADP